MTTAHSSRSSTAVLGAQAKVVSKDLQKLGGNAVEVVQEKFGELRDSASEYYEQGKEKLNEAEETLEKFIRNKPLKSVLIAAGIGWFLGRYWMRH